MENMPLGIQRPDVTEDLDQRVEVCVLVQLGVVDVVLVSQRASGFLRRFGTDDDNRSDLLEVQQRSPGLVGLVIVLA